MKRIGILFLAAMISTSYAAIYVNQSNPNSTEYSDTPSANAAEVNVPPVNSVATQVPQSATDANTSKPNTTSTGNSAVSTEDTYKVFQITKPTNGETIQNQPVIPVEMQIEPVLKGGDKVQLYIDGSPVGTPNGTAYQELGLVERGTHTLYGAIMNSQNQPIKRSNNVTLYVHRNSTITSPQTPPPPAPKPAPPVN